LCSASSMMKITLIGFEELPGLVVRSTTTGIEVDARNLESHPRYYEQAGAGRNEQAEGPASDGAGSGTIKNVEGGSQDLGQAAAPGYDDEMPKIDPATRVQQFLLGDAFQTEFDEWAARMEKEHGGKLEMTHEEIIHDGARILIWWRIVPRHHVTGTRR